MLVTGATSAVGMALMTEMLVRKIPVRAFLHKASVAEKLQRQGIETFVGDMAEQKSVQKALQGIESIYLIVPTSEHLFTIEQLWIEEAKKVGIRHLVTQSEIGADPQSFCPLLQLHGRAEEVLRASGLPYTILRTLYLMQNFGPMYAQSILAEGMMYAPLGQGSVSYVDERDVARVAIHLLTEEKYYDQEYEVTGPEALSCTRLAEVFSTLLGKPVRFTNVSDEEAEQGLLKLYSPWAAHAVVTLLQFYRQGGGDFVSASIGKIAACTPCTVSTYISEHLPLFQST